MGIVKPPPGNHGGDFSILIHSDRGAGSLTAKARAITKKVIALL